MKLKLDLKEKIKNPAIYRHMDEKELKKLRDKQLEWEKILEI
jgi:hypothetical protein